MTKMPLVERYCVVKYKDSKGWLDLSGERAGVDLGDKAVHDYRD